MRSHQPDENGAELDDVGVGDGVKSSRESVEKGDEGRSDHGHVTSKVHHHVHGCPYTKVGDQEC